MMTRKDFVLIAETLNANHASPELVLDFADMLEETNPRFDRARFVQHSTTNVVRILDSQVKMLDRESRG